MYNKLNKKKKKKSILGKRMIQSSIRLDDDEEVWLKGQLMGNTISGAPIQDVVINNITMMPNP